MMWELCGKNDCKIKWTLIFFGDFEMLLKFEKTLIIVVQCFRISKTTPYKASILTTVG